MTSDPATTAPRCATCRDTGEVFPWYDKERGIRGTVPVPCPDCDEGGVLERCPRCGQVGTMKHGELDDCRSEECMGDKADDAELRMESR